MGWVTALDTTAIEQYVDFVAVLLDVWYETL